MALASPAGQTGLDLDPPRHRAPAQQGIQRLSFFFSLFLVGKKENPSIFQDLFLAPFFSPDFFNVASSSSLCHVHDFLFLTNRSGKMLEEQQKILQELSYVSGDKF